MTDFRRVFETNLFGPVALTKLVLPWLRRASGRIIVLSSVGGAIGQPFNEAYCGSKFALEGVFETLRPVATRLGVAVSIIEPGPVQTNLSAGIDMAQRLAAAGPYHDVLEAFLTTAADVERSPFQPAQSPEDVATLISDVLDDPRPRLRYQTSPRPQGLISPKLADLTGQAYDTLMDDWLQMDESQHSPIGD